LNITAPQSLALQVIAFSLEIEEQAASGPEGFGAMQLLE
jgi:hypothetical protein